MPGSQEDREGSLRTGHRPVNLTGEKAGRRRVGEKRAKEFAARPPG